jgi:hypothetical protein
MDVMWSISLAAGYDATHHSPLSDQHTPTPHDMTLRTAAARLCTITLVTTLCSALTACQDDVGLVPVTVLRPAAIAFYGDTTVVTLPDSARAGQPFVVQVRSFGGGCIQQDQMAVVVTGSRVDLRPLVREPHPAASVVCTADLRLLTHSAPVTIATPGTATVVVHGRVEPGATARQVTRTVRVVP